MHTNQQTLTVVPSSLQMSQQPSSSNLTYISSSCFAHLFAGASSGIVTAVLTSPLDVLRTRLQSDFYRNQLSKGVAPHGHDGLISLSIRNFRETLHILATIPRVEGWRGLFSGLGPFISGIAPATAIKFFTYGNTKLFLTKNLKWDSTAPTTHATAAATAGIVTGTLTNPIWVIKTRLQLDKPIVSESGQTSPRRYKNAFDCFSKILRVEGVSGFYKGLGASYLGTVETVLHLTIYERLKLCALSSENGLSLSPNLDKYRSWFYVGFLGGLSKFVTVVLAYPHEVVRTRLRQAPLSRDANTVKYTGLIQCFRLVYKEEGIRALYGGLTAHLLRSVPSAAITLGVYEVVLKFLNASI